VIRYALTIFLSAFLLFQVQPMIAKFILPWFGGSSLVWTTSMLFFQTALLAGYAYAHVVATVFGRGVQMAIHGVLLVAALFFLPVAPAASLRPTGGADPTMGVLVVLAISIGLPFFMLATTGPLIQSWQSATHPHRSPYRLYALSNLGSLLALLTYPFWIEPHLRLGSQSWFWSAGFVVFAALSLSSAWQAVRRAPTTQPGPNPAAPASTKPSTFDDRTTAPRVFMWFALPMAASVMLLATTNLLTQEVAAVPFLWLAPLTLYLLSFIIAFDHSRWYVRPLFLPLLFVVAVATSLVAAGGPESPLPYQLIGFPLLCFLVSMTCHGELVRLKPAPRHLTGFYLMVALGGAAGGVLVAVVAPRVLTDCYEYFIGLIATLVLVIWASSLERRTRPDGPRLAMARLGFFVLSALGAVASASIVLVIYLRLVGYDSDEKIVDKRRNSYGVLTVHDQGSYLSLTNGRIRHGQQYKDDYWRRQPVSYYGPTSGMGIAVDFMRRESLGQEGLHIGAIGLGTGTIAAYGDEGDRVRFYEINPAVESVARTFFTYLADTPAATQIVLGDARVQLERELEEGDAQGFNILAVDAFSSDSIPLHLLTEECFAVYDRHLAPGGIIAVHISNRFLDLHSVVFNAAKAHGMQAILIVDYPSATYDSTEWVLVSRNERLLRSAEVRAATSGWPDDMPEVKWTDDFASLWPIVNLSWKIDWKELKELVIDREKPENEDGEESE